MLPSRNEIVTEVILWREHAFVLSHQLQLGSTGSLAGAAGWQFMVLAPRRQRESGINPGGREPAVREKGRVGEIRVRNGLRVGAIDRLTKPFVKFVGQQNISTHAVKLLLRQQNAQTQAGGTAAATHALIDRHEFHRVEGAALPRQQFVKVGTDARCAFALARSEEESAAIRHRDKLAVE